MISGSNEPRKGEDGNDLPWTDSAETVDGARGTGQEFFDPDRRSIWIRGLIMIIFAIFFGIAEALLFICAVVQFLWMLFSKKPNKAIIKFGASLGKWLERVALFQTGASENLPFPWSEWE